MKLINPLLDEFIRVDGGNGIPVNVIERVIAQQNCQKDYAWAIPTLEAVQLIAQYDPIIEVGAGTGYWAWMLQQLGLSVECYDNYSSHVRTHGFWYRVHRGSWEKAYSRKNLFLCWPPYDNSFGYRALKCHRGEYVIYIGEGYGGCTGCYNFHDLLSESYRQVNTCKIPQWYGLHDYLSVWKRHGS